MALYSKKDDALPPGRKPEYVKRLIDKKPSLIQHGGFFVSTEGKGIKIDYVERRQAVKRMRSKGGAHSQKDDMPK